MAQSSQASLVQESIKMFEACWKVPLFTLESECHLSRPDSELKDHVWVGEVPNWILCGSNAPKGWRDDIKHPSEVFPKSTAWKKGRYLLQLVFNNDPANSDLNQIRYYRQPDPNTGEWDVAVYKSSKEIPNGMTKLRVFRLQPAKKEKEFLLQIQLAKNHPKWGEVRFENVSRMDRAMTGSPAPKTYSFQDPVPPEEPAIVPQYAPRFFHYDYYQIEEMYRPALFPTPEQIKFQEHPGNYYRRFHARNVVQPAKGFIKKEVAMYRIADYVKALNHHHQSSTVRDGLYRLNMMHIKQPKSSPTESPPQQFVPSIENIDEVQKEAMFSEDAS